MKVEECCIDGEKCTSCGECEGTDIEDLFCVKCGGSGWIMDDPCEYCQGTGIQDW